MAGTGGEDGYSDDDLDALGSDDFLELQEQALQATQQRDAPNQLQHLLLRGQPISQREIDHVTKDTPTGLGPVLPAPNPRALNTNLHISNAQPTSSAGVKVSGRQRGPNEVVQREQWRLQRFGNQRSDQRPEASQQKDPSNLALPHRAASQEVSYGAPQPTGQDEVDRVAGHLGQEATNPGGEIQAAMQQLLLEKETWIAEKTSLEQAVKTTNDQLLGKTGEIAILRSNHAKQVQDRERKLEDLKREQRAQDEQHRTAVEQIRKEKEKLVTQNRFLDHENHERAWTARVSKKGTRVMATTDEASTPRRLKGPELGDGFEDNELERLSPSKMASRQKGTPKAGAKRKRDIFNLSPATHAELPQGMNEASFSARPSPRSEVRQGPTALHALNSARSEFLHKLLYHKARSDEIRVFEKMVKFSFPVQSTVSLAEIFMDKLPPGSAADELEDIPASYGLVLLNIWARCLTERYYPPIEPLIDLLRFILLNGTMSTAIRLMDDIVNLSQRTADINIIPRFKKLNKNAKVISVHLHDQTLESSNDVNTQHCLQLLYMTASLCTRDHNAMTRFWHCMRFDFISMVLRVVQTIDDIILMVRLLQSCVDHDIFAAIKPQSTEGGSAEQHVIDRLSSMLIEVPRPIDEAEPYDITDILRMRLNILGLVEKMCEQKLCSRAFATHPLALGRLVRIINDELNAIYANQYCQETRSEIINRAIQILFYLTSMYSQEIDFQEKLRRQPGGVNKFLITLSRLAFSDAVWYERGISEDAFDCAHQLLEDFVTPEEAEALKKAFVREEG